MTIFEMLEKLETEIVSLQARYQDLATALQHAQANGNGSVAPATKKKRTSAGTKRKVAKKRAERKPARKGPAIRDSAEAAQLELPVPGAAAPSAEQTPARPLGKRQALGKSLIQLRKMSAWRAARSGDES